MRRKTRAVGTLLLSFKVKLGVSCTKFIPAGLYGVKSFYHLSFYCAIMPLAYPGAALCLLDGLFVKCVVFFVSP